MTIRDFAILRHRLVILARTTVLFGLATIKIVSPNYLLFWSGGPGWPAQLFILKLADFEKFTIEDMLTFVASAVSCHAMIAERSYGDKR